MTSFLGYDYVNPVRITNNQPSSTTDTQSLKIQSVRTGAQRWDLSIVFRGGIGENMYGVFLSHYLTNGSMNPFNIPIPQPYGVAGPELDAAIATGGTPGAKSVTLDSPNDVFDVGYMFKFSNHPKVYMVTSQSGTSLSFAPGLVETVADTDNIDNTDPMMAVYHSGTNTSVTTQPDGTQSLTWSFTEAL